MITRDIEKGIALRDKIERYSESVFLYVDTRYIKVRLDEILYVEAYGDYMKVVLSDDHYMTRITVKKLNALLPEEDFVRVHRSFIVRLDKIDELSNHFIKIAQKNIPISKLEKDNLVKKLPIIS